jgi:hypothetical protein
MVHSPATMTTTTTFILPWHTMRLPVKLPNFLEEEEIFGVLFALPFHHCVDELHGNFHALFYFAC